jgi:hypothetical protein
MNGESGAGERRVASVSEVTPTFIPVVLEAEAREAKKGLWLIRSRCRRGSGGRGKSVSWQTLLLGVEALGFSLRRSQRDANGRPK